MIFNLNRLKSENIILTNTDEQFVGTDLELQEFMIEVKRLSRADKIDVASEAMGDNGTISSGKYSEAMFKASIVNIEGLTDEEGNAITMETKAVDLIWEYAPDLMVNAIKEKIESFNVVAEKKSESLENGYQDTPIGS